MAGLLSKIAGGVNRFSDELLAPTNPLGKLGMYLGAASGGVLGQASLAHQQDQLSRGDADLDRQYKQAQIAKLAQGPNNDTINDYNFIFEKQGQAAADSYLSNLASGPPIAVDVAQPDGSVVRQYMPRAQFNIPPRAAPPGVTFTPLDDGGPAPKTSAPFR